MATQKKSRIHIIAPIISGIFMLVASIISSPQWFKYVFPNQYVEQEEITPKISSKQKESKENEESGGTENLVVKNIELCPINSKIPSYFFIEIKNLGSKIINDFSLDIDLGRAIFQKIDIQKPNNSSSSIDTTLNNRILLQYSKVAQNESIIIYALLSQPVFNSIKLNGSNLNAAKEYTYKNYVDSKLETRNAIFGFYVFLFILAGGVLVVLAIYLLNIVYTFLKRWLKWT